MIIRILFISTILFVVSNSLAQTTESILATFGSEKISSNEIKFRYELMPHLSKRQFNPEEAKLDFLYSLISEKMWARKAKELGLEARDDIRSSNSYIEKLLVRDALFKEVIAKRINISEEDIQKGINYSGTTLTVNIISSIDLAEIHKVYSLLLKGLPLESASESNSYKIQFADSVELTYGMLEEETLEDTVFALALNQFSKPIKNKRGWFIFYPVNKVYSIVSNKDSDKIRANVIRSLRERRTKRIGESYLKNFFDGKNISINESMFQNFTERTHNLLRKKQLQENLSENDTLYLNAGNVNSLLESYSEEELSTIIVQADECEITLNDFVYYLIFEGFRTKGSKIDLIAKNLKLKLHQFIEHEILACEGYKKGLQNNPELKNELDIWSNSHLAQALRNSFHDSVSVSDEDVHNYYLRLQDKIEQVTYVNVAKIVTDSLELVEKLFIDLNAGKKFEELIHYYNKIKEDSVSENEYLPVTSFGELSNVVENLKIGKVSGPFKTNEGFLIIKLIDKKEKTQKYDKPFKEVSSELKNILRYLKLKVLYDNYTVQLAEEYNLKIDNQALLKLNLSSIPMFTYRYIGFGGRISASSFVTPWYEWFEIFRKKKELAP
ncbi:MAG: peptidyl-prolyl cis-trans isomerase [Bacteroidetes bacterium]|nr:peptidyl-prolyl cis-trans isomerase [Bacteroidota bacterium]MBU2584251.1 peptidyl-prolyl cis-trans isomerase [Bacteroidota bacterium]